MAIAIVILLVSLPLFILVGAGTVFGLGTGLLLAEAAGPEATLQGMFLFIAVSTTVLGAEVAISLWERNWRERGSALLAGAIVAWLGWTVFFQVRHAISGGKSPLIHLTILVLLFGASYFLDRRSERKGKREVRRS
uniref:Uncharacterized protein n=1 Tax=candidate division WWE3 bacterium TaxID=2053526 RepID=A0A831Z2M4_UNCKA